MYFKERFKELVFDEAKVWCRGRMWQARLPFLLWFAYVLVKYWIDPIYGTVLSPVNLGIHELGHFVFSPFGIFMNVVGGTLLQISAPLALMVNFYRQKDFFAITLCFGWLSTNLFEVARYVADASLMNLPLVSPFGGDTVIHDWNYILSRFGILHYDTVIAFFIKCSATISMLICLLTGAWVLWQMKNLPKKELL